MPRAIPVPIRQQLFSCWRDHAVAHDVALEFSLSVRSIQRLFLRFAQRGDEGIAADYGACGQHQDQRTPDELVEQICQIRRDHPRWGSEMIRLELAEPTTGLPCARTLRRHLLEAGLQPAPAGRPLSPSPRVSRAERPHQGWQVDACEYLRLRNQQRVSWLRVVDECTGAFLQTVVFASARWEQVERHGIQDAFRAAFRRWGLPERVRVDNDYPWGNSGDLPPELALWLLGLGLEMVWIPPACPRENGVVERSQDIGQDWFEPETCGDAAELQQRCDTYDRRQRERYPYCHGLSRWQVYPTLRHSGRPYRLRQ